MKKTLFLFGLTSFILLACNPAKRLNKNYQFFQRGMDSISKIDYKELVIKPYDVLNILAYSESLNQEQIQLFNLGNKSAGSTGTATPVDGYFVDADGYVFLPLVGKVKASGLSVNQLSDTLKTLLEKKVKNPGIYVRYAPIQINILGEVRAQGNYVFSNPRVNIFEAISKAGGLNEFGKREDLLVIRESNGERKSYNVDLRNGNVFHSPAFQLQQNDIIYVGANNIKLRSANIDPVKQANLSLIFGLVSTLGFLVNIISIFKK